MKPVDINNTWILTLVILVKSLRVNGDTYPEIARKLKTPVKLVMDYDGVELGKEYAQQVYEYSEYLKPEYDPLKVKDLLRALRSFELALSKSPPSKLMDLYNTIKSDIS